MDLKWRVQIVEEAIELEESMLLDSQYKLELSLLNNLLSRNDHTPAGVVAFENQFRRVNECAERIRERNAKRARAKMNENPTKRT